MSQSLKGQNREIEEHEDPKIVQTDADIDFGQVWKDILNFRQEFKVQDFAFQLIFGLGPSAVDIYSDFKFAESVDVERFTWGIPNLSLLFIAGPGIVFFIMMAQKAIERCLKPWKNETRKWYVSNGLSLLVVTAIAGGLLSLLYHRWQEATNPICKGLAGIVATILLLVKVVGVMVHSTEVKRMTVKASSYEGSYESSLQLSLVIYIWLGGGKLNKFSAATSLIMLSKAGAENFLTFGKEDKLKDKDFFPKLFLLAKYLPVFSLIGFFRVGTLSVCFAWSHLIQFFITMPLAINLPLGVLFLLKWCKKLPNLSLTEIVQGVLGEVTTSVLWGRLGREGSRKIQLFIGGYLLLLYSGILCMVMAHPDCIKMCFDIINWCSMCYDTELFNKIPIFILASGWMGYVLFFFQVFCFGGCCMDCRKK